MCPAKNAVCFKCQRRGHFANVCKSKVFKNINARVSSSTLCVIHETPNCLTQASLTAKIADTEVSALIDSSSSMSFINKDTAKRLNIEINPCFDNVSMATTSLTENISGCCNVDITVNGSNYSNVKLRVLKNLCTDILLGQDFQSLHKQVIFRYKGKRDDFVISRSTCALAPALAKHPSLFHNLSKACKPIAIKSRRFNSNDQMFINKEIGSPYRDNAPSFSSGSIKEFLLKRGVASSKSSPYHPLVTLKQSVISVLSGNQYVFL